MAKSGPVVPIPGRGDRLRAEISAAHTLDPSQLVLLEEACRCADRLDQLDAIIAGKGVLQLLHFRSMVDDGDERSIVMTVDGVMSEARQQQTVFKQLLAALRLPDEAAGKRPQQRGGARGAYKPKAGSVSSLDRARARSGA